MLHSLAFIVDIQNQTFHFCDQTLGWVDGSIENEPLWHDINNYELTSSVKSVLLDNNVAIAITDITEIRSCGQSIDYEVTFKTTTEYEESLDFFIHSNGSKFAGSSPDPINKLMQNLSKYSLDEKFFESGIKHPLFFLNPSENQTTKRFNGHIQYIGNFKEYSAGFNIYVLKGSDTEKTLDRLIQKNLTTHA